MIQYKHYHDVEEGYKSVTSQNAPDEDVSVFKALGAFEREGDVCFTYFYQQGKGYFYQKTCKGDVFAHGLCDEVSTLGKGYAAEYIGQLETKYKKETNEEGYLPDGKLPYRRAECDLSLGRGLQPVFARIADTLLYTDKPVVLTGKNMEELIRYVKVALLLFPAQYANTVGFSVCPQYLPDVFGDKEKAIGRNVRLIATDEAVQAYSGWTVIDVNGTWREENGEELRPYAKAIDGLQRYIVSGNGNRTAALLNAVCASFGGDGSVDTETLETAICVYNFSAEHTPERAAELIGAKKADRSGVILSSMLTEAVFEILNKSNLTEQEEGLIEYARTDGKVNELVKQQCGRYAFAKLAQGQKLTGLQEEDVISFLEGLPAEELKGDGAALQAVFGALRAINTLSVFCKAYAQTKRKELLKVIADYVDVRKTYNAAGDFDGEMFALANGYAKERADLLGAMTSTCFIAAVLGSASAREKTTRRLHRFAQMSMEEKDNIRLVEGLLAVKQAVERVAGDEMSLADDFDFLHKDDLTALIARLTFEDCLALVNGSVKVGDYTALQDGIFSRLTSFDEVKKNVTLEKNLAEYRLFKERYDAVSVDGSEIDEYLGVLSKSESLREHIAEYRRQFIVGKYNASSLGQRKKIVANAAKSGKTYVVKKGTATEESKDEIRDTLMDKNSSFDEKERLTNIITEVLYKKTAEQQAEDNSRNVQFLIYSCLFGVLFMLLAAAAFAVLPIVSSVLLEVDMIKRVIGFFSVYHIAALAYVGGLNVMTYAICLKKSNQDRLGSLKKSRRVALLYGVLPILLYSAVYAVTYFLL